MKKKKYNPYWIESKKKVFGNGSRFTANTNDSRNQRFYKSKQWQQTRDYIIRLYPECVRCLENNIITEATDVNHIVNINIDWNRRLDIDNLEALCKSCHWKYTQQEIRERKQEIRDIIINDTMDELENHINNNEEL